MKKPVRCKKCRWFDKEIGWCRLLKVGVTKDWFCGSAWRRRKHG